MGTTLHSTEAFRMINLGGTKAPTTADVVDTYPAVSVAVAVIVFDPTTMGTWFAMNWLPKTVASTFRFP